MPRVYIPALLQPLSKGEASIEIKGTSVHEVIAALDELYPGFADRLLDGDRLRPSIAVAVDGEVEPDGLRAKVACGSEVHFVGAVRGGFA